MRTLWQVFQQQTQRCSDAELLRDFVLHKSEAAFTQLVQRHGGLVQGVCLRTLGHTQDAEDAFQATFLVLAQKAGQLHTGTGLGPWLYGVARRVALKARNRRPRAHLLVDDQQLPCEEASDVSREEWADLGPILDAEIEKLPTLYRQALILCHMSGLTKAEAAREVGCPEGTISSRLMRARQLLKHRLTRRGISLATIPVLDALLAPSLVSANLIQSTVSLGMNTVLGITSTTAAAVPVLSLAQGVNQAMYLTKLKMIALAATLSVGLVAGTGIVTEGWGQEKGKKVTGPAPIAARSFETNPEIAPHSRLNSIEDVNNVLNQTHASLAVMTGNSMPLEEYLQLVENKLGLVSIIDGAAFRDIFSEFDQKEFRQQKLDLPRMNNQSTSTILHSLLDGVRIKEQAIPATFMIRQGTLVIVPKDYVHNAALKLQVALDTNKKDMTLAEALNKLSHDTGVSIIVDNRMQDMAQSTKINTSFRNLKLINAVRLLVSNAELSVIMIDGALYVSSPENCQKMELEIDRQQGR